MASLINHHSVNLLRLGALVFGVSYGFSKQRSLTYYVKDRNEQNSRRKYEDLVEEGKLAFEAQEKKEEAELAKKDGVPCVDFESYKFNDDLYFEWKSKQLETQK
ncbi:hypothetical protein HDV06_000887 [Boothiomyces sp. JEL0866]|nr:hypothetical protein HDV06_000887 [Boothiomyces sp. JEL0866]